MNICEAVIKLNEYYEEAKGYDYVEKPLSWALYHTWKDSEKEEEYERCVVCQKMTKVKVKDHAVKRRYYIEGAGQLCRDCWERIYK